MLQEKLYVRDRYVLQLHGFAFAPVVKILTGMRRVGKSSIVKSYIQQSIQYKALTAEYIWYINKELLKFDAIRTYQDLNLLFLEWRRTLPKQSSKFLIAIDEIQEIDGWERFIASVLAEFQQQVDIVITGSNSNMLSSHLATLLSGRYVEIRVFPLDFPEYCGIRSIDETKDNFLQYLQFGGMPGLFAMKSDPQFLNSYLQGIYATAVLKDVIEYFSVRNTEFLKILYQYVFTNIGNIFSAKSIVDYLKSQRISVSVDTVLKYLSHAEDAYLIYKVKSCDPGTKKIFSIYQKYYIADLGLRNAMTGYLPVRDQGRILENYVYLLLLLNGYDVYIGRLKNNKEVDFIAEKQGKKFYIQVCYLLTDQSVIDREYSALESIQDNWPKYVVSMDEQDLGVRNGIEHISLMDMTSILE